MRDKNTYFSNVSALSKIRISGSSALEFIRVMTSVDLWRIELPGQAAPALILNAEAEIIDLVMVVRTGQHEFMLIGNPATEAELTQWLEAHSQLQNEQAAAFEDIKVENRTEQIAALALYGPKAQMILDELSQTDLSAELGDKNLTIIKIGELHVMVLRWPLLRAHGLDMPLNPEGEVFEVFLPAQAAAVFEQILLGFEEINPESFASYKARRIEAHTWFNAAEAAAYIKPQTPELQALLRSTRDFVGARAL